MEYKIEKNIPIPSQYNWSKSKSHELDFMIKMQPNESVAIYPSTEDVDWWKDRDTRYFLKTAQMEKYKEIYSFISQRIKKINPQNKTGEFFIARQIVCEDGRLGHRWFCVKKIHKNNNNL